MEISIDENSIIHFQNSVLFEIEQISKYVHELAKDFFKKNNITITHEEFRTLDVLYCNPDCCQRDLAKLILRDRIYTGRLIDSLEKKGLIERRNDTKGKRLVKKMNITEKGIDCYNSTIRAIQPQFKKLEEKFTLEQMQALRNTLQKLKQNISEIVDLKI